MKRIHRERNGLSRKKDKLRLKISRRDDPPHKVQTSRLPPTTVSNEDEKPAVCIRNGQVSAGRSRPHITTNSTFQ